jgi:hypothetical protein
VVGDQKEGRAEEKPAALRERAQLAGELCRGVAETDEGHKVEMNEDLLDDLRRKGSAEAGSKS